MKKYVKIIGIIVVLVSWIMLVTIDCIRLNNSNQELKPIITIMSKEYEEKYEYGIEYIGLGYSVKHYHEKNTMGYGTIVNLFYIFPLPYMAAD